MNLAAACAATQCFHDADMFKTPFSTKTHMGRPEERAAVRKVLRTRVKVVVAGGPALLGKTLDISATGLGVIVEQPIGIGHNCMIGFETSVKGVMKQINAVAKVVYCICSGTEGFRIGFQFGELTAANTAVINELVTSDYLGTIAK